MPATRQDADEHTRPRATTHRVAVVAFAGISPFHLAVPSAVLASGGGVAPHTGYEVAVCAERPGRVPTSAGYDIVVGHGLELLTEARTVVLPSWDTHRDPPPALVEAVRAAHGRGARVVGLCLGAYVVAASGIADGRTLATHWHAADDLARRYPAVRVRSDILWSDLGDVVTSAGVAAALDTCLHVVRTDLGVTMADSVARALVLAPHRDGAQTQFIPAPVSRRPARTRSTGPSSGRSTTSTIRSTSTRGPSRCISHDARSPAGSGTGPGSAPAGGSCSSAWHVRACCSRPPT